MHTVELASAVEEELAALVGRAAVVDLGDARAVALLRAAAHRVTTRLAVSGRLPGHLAVSRDDPGVVVVKTLAVAARALGNTAPQRGEDRTRPADDHAPRPVG